MNPRISSLECWEKEALQAYLADKAAYQRIRSASDLEALIRASSQETRFVLQTTSTNPAPDFEQRLVALFAE